MKRKVDYCYHTHTTRCGHAIGKDEEYVISAIENGFKVLGFSDHAIIRGVSHKGMRGDYYLLNDYITSINNLKEKYKDKIEIHIGFEAEYSKVLVPYYKELLESKKIEYLILGQHGYFDDNSIWHYHFRSNPEFFGNLDCYVKYVIEGLHSGLFKYLCHPDLFVVEYGMHSKETRAAARKILKACEETNTPIEINLNGWTWKNKITHKYPNAYFFKLASEYNVKVIIGVDAHYPGLFKEADYKHAFDLIKRYNLNYIDRIEL